MTALVNADLFRIVANFISTEQTRYYLNGVFIHPHQLKGVYLVATDGQRMMIAHDENGSMGSIDNAGIIVRLDKVSLNACKPAKHEPDERLLQIDGDGRAQVLSGTDDRLPVAIHHGAIVDGTFPDWRRVACPSLEETAPTTFNGMFLADFGKAAKELARGDTHGIRVIGETNGPNVIRFLGVEHAYGVLMPIRDPHGTNTLPWFVNAAPADAREAAE
jgi:hypothetical protein